MSASPARSLTAAAVQFSALPGEVERNLTTAGRLVDSAADQGAHLIPLPELAPGGYVLTDSIWAISRAA